MWFGMGEVISFEGYCADGTGEAEAWGVYRGAR